MSAPSSYSRIALVEDDPFMGSLVLQMLALHDVSATHYQVGHGLLASPLLPQYQVIILDLSLPDIDGFDMIEALARRAPHIALLLISGRGHATLDSARLVAEGLGCTVIATLNKPFSSQEMCMALKLESAFLQSQGGLLA